MREKPIRVASSRMCSSSVDPIPDRLRALVVRMDFSSACDASRAFTAPQPTTASPSSTDQNVISGRRSASRSSACLLSSGVMERISSMCSVRKAAMAGPDRSSTTIRMGSSQVPLKSPTCYRGPVLPGVREASESIRCADAGQQNVWPMVVEWRRSYSSYQGSRTGLSSPARSAHLREDEAMSGIRVLVGTKKGAFTLTSDGKRDKWTVDGPHFGGWEVYHLNGSPADPDRIYASASGGWFGQVMHRSDDGGKTWNAVGNDFTYTGEVGEHLWYDGTPRPWEFKRIWHIEPTRDDPDTVYAGAEDAALYISNDGGQKWTELTALRQHETGPRWQPGAGGMCLHTIVLDPAHKDRIYVAISA